ncbi:MAG: hypothetical protein WC838_03860 [Candidatus Margulisiibacteriota bacterium]|jgi:hydrogenase-4 component E
MELPIIFLMMVFSYALVADRRVPNAINNFRWQSFFLFLLTLLLGFKEKELALILVAGLLFGLKVVAIPYFLQRTHKELKASDDLGYFLDPQLSMVLLLVLSYLSWTFVHSLFPACDRLQLVMLTSSFIMAISGMILMVLRMTALAQIIGLLVMENGLFLLASSLSGGMPFFVETAVFFDVFVSVIISGVFVYRIKKYFTHIDVNKLSRLRG